MIRERYGEGINVDAIPLDDAATYKLYERGDTVGVFQFESSNLRPWLERLHPREFDDLIAINALYRPGPMDYLPLYCAKKNGEEAITYELPEMEEFLCDYIPYIEGDDDMLPFIKSRSCSYQESWLDSLKLKLICYVDLSLKERRSYLQNNVSSSSMEESLRVFRKKYSVEYGMTG